MELAMHSDAELHRCEGVEGVVLFHAYARGSKGFLHAPAPPARACDGSLRSTHSTPSHPSGYATTLAELPLHMERMNKWQPMFTAMASTASTWITSQSQPDAPCLTPTRAPATAWTTPPGNAWASAQVLPWTPPRRARPPTLPATPRQIAVVFEVWGSVRPAMSAIRWTICPRNSWSTCARDREHSGSAARASALTGP